MLILPKKYEVKNKIWQYYTPNEVHPNEELSRKVLGISYSQLESAWARRHKIPGKKKWFEVRVKSVKTELDSVIKRKQKWWDEPEFMDKIFWVYQTPFLYDIDGQNVFCYALEHFECIRVRNHGKERLGYNPFSSDYPSLLLPKDCTHLAWTETSGGYSDHLRHRPEVIPTQQQVDKEKTLEEKVKIITKEIYSIPANKQESFLGKGNLKDEVV